jgi:hypothetical protein
MIWRPISIGLMPVVRVRVNTSPFYALTGDQMIYAGCRE